MPGAGLEVVRIPNGHLVENCFLVADRSTGEAAVVDPGEEAPRFLAEATRRGWRISAIWLTHAHIDHIAGVAAVKAATGAPIHLHPAERPIYDALPQFGTWIGQQLEVPPPPDVLLRPGVPVRIGAHAFDVRWTPGHSPGSVSFVGAGMIFGGDVLFAGSVGRTDLPGGDTATLIRSIQTVFMVLPDTTVVHTGHGPSTTVGVERLSNPFLVGASRVG